jgi:maltoporin
MKMRWTAWAVVAVALLSHAAPTAALDFFGYFRDSIAGNSRGGGQACFKTPGMDYKLRLGNECDAYAEWGLQQSVWKGKDGVEFTVGFMFDYDPAVMGNTGASTPFGVQQNYVKMKVPQWGNGAQFWAGKQYYRRENIDMIDFFYLNTSEPGIGVEDWDLGFGKLSASVFGVAGNNTAPSPTSHGLNQAFFRPDVRISDIPLNPNGTIEIAANLVIYSRNDVSNAGVPVVPKGANDADVSAWLTLQHTQKKLLGGSNKLTLQWANGAAAQMGPGTPSFGDDPLNKNNMQFRVLDQLLLQPSLKFQSLIGVVAQWKTQYVTTTKTDFTQIGIFARPVYYFADYFKLQGDIGWTQNKPKDAAAMDLFKLCIAPTLTPSPGDEGGFFVRPEIRVFVTYASWNDAAAAQGANAPGGGMFGTDKSGFTYGASVETWF